MATTRTGMLGTSRLANSANPIRAKASGLMNASSTDSHIGELMGVVIAELFILGVIRHKLRKHHGG